MGFVHLTLFCTSLSCFSHQNGSRVGINGVKAPTFKISQKQNKQKTTLFHFTTVFLLALWGVVEHVSMTNYSISAKLYFFILPLLGMQSVPVAFCLIVFSTKRDESEALLTRIGWQCGHQNSLNLLVQAWLSFSPVISLNACQFALVSHFIKSDRSFHPNNVPETI